MHGNFVYTLLYQWNFHLTIDRIYYKENRRMIDERNVTCFFTGHRSIPKDSMSLLTEKIDRTIEDLLGKGYCRFVCGGAVGFDTIAACRVIVAKSKHPEIEFHLVLPCRDQTAKWRNGYDLALYQRIKGLADSVTYVTDTYTSGCMHQRNRMMADMSSVCIAYYNGTRGGTSYTVRYAIDSGISLINLYDDLKISN